MALFGKMFGGKDREEKSPGKKKPPSQELPEINLDDLDEKKSPPGQKIEPSPFDPMPSTFEPTASPTPIPSPTPQSTKTSSRRSSRVGGRGTPIGELLIQAGAISTEQLSKALKIQEQKGKGLLGQILVEMGACTPTDVSEALNKQFRITGVDLAMIDPSPPALALVTKEQALDGRLVPIEKLGALLCVAMANVLNRKAINELEQLTNCRVKPFNSTWPEIQDAITRFYTTELMEVAAGLQEAAPEEVSLE